MRTGRHRLGLAASAVPRLALALALSQVLAGGTARADFAGSLVGKFQPLRRALGDSVARSLPLVSASSPFRYAFDPRTNVFERLPGISGHTFLESPDVIGAGRINLSASYTDVDFSELDGTDLDNLVSVETIPLEEFPNYAVRLRQDLHLMLDVDQVVLAATYGLADAAEVNVTLPIVKSTFRVSGRVDTSLLFLADPDRSRLTKTTRAGGKTQEAAGVGDLVLRGKYHLLTTGLFSLGVGLGLRTPTGDEDNFQGTGDLGLLPALFVATKPWRVASWATLSARVNLGAEVDVQTPDRSEARWGVGMDVGIKERGALALAVLGRDAFTSSLPHIPIDCQGSICLQKLAVPATLGAVSIASDRPDFFDLAIGGRVVLWPEWLVLFANVLLPLNDDGFRPDLTPLAGVEAVF